MVEGHGRVPGNQFAAFVAENPHRSPFTGQDQFRITVSAQIAPDRAADQTRQTPTVFFIQLKLFACPTINPRRCRLGIPPPRSPFRPQTIPECHRHPCPPRPAARHWTPVPSQRPLSSGRTPAHNCPPPVHLHNWPARSTQPPPSLASTKSRPWSDPVSPPRPHAPRSRVENRHGHHCGR